MTDTVLPPAAQEVEFAEVAELLEQLRLTEGRLARRRRRRESGLTETDRAAIRYLLERPDGEDSTPSMIARALHLAPASGPALIDRLVERRVIFVEAHPHDRRKKLVRLVDRGADPDHVDPLTTRLRAIVAQLTVADARVVASFLRTVLGAVGGTPSSTGQPLPTDRPARTNA